MTAGRYTPPRGARARYEVAGESWLHPGVPAKSCQDFCGVDWGSCHGVTEGVRSHFPPLQPPFGPRCVDLLKFIWFFRQTP